MTKMLDKKSSKGPSDALPGVAEVETRKVYRKPRLVEWGSIVDLTHGPTAGLQDYPPAVTGTEPF